VTVDAQLVLLRDGQGLTIRHSELPLDQILARDHLGDGVLDLQARVHLHKVVLIVRRVHDELHRACSAVAYCSRGIHSRLTHGATQFF
jgi:hypothetical protein